MQVLDCEKREYERERRPGKSAWIILEKTKIHNVRFLTRVEAPENESKFFVAFVEESYQME